MNITESIHNNIRVLKPDGRIDGEGAIDLELALQEAFAAGEFRMILDLSQVSYINSAGLRILAAILTQNQANDGDLLLAAVSERIRRVLQIIGFDNYFRMLDTVELAVQAY